MTTHQTIRCARSCSGLAVRFWAAGINSDSAAAEGRMNETAEYRLAPGNPSAKPGRKMIMAQQFRFNRTVLAGAVVATMLVSDQGEAATLVEFTFDAGTNVAATVASHINATPMIVQNGTTGVSFSHNFIDVGSGNLAIHAEWDSLRFLFDFTADPGYTFQLTDIAVGWGHDSYAGGSRTLALRPNGESSEAGLFSVSGGPMFSTYVPGVPYEVIGSWNSLSARTDLTSLMFRMSFSGNSTGDDAYISYVRFSGDLAPVPVPAACWLLGSGLLGLIGVAKRRNESRTGGAARFDAASFASSTR